MGGDALPAPLLALGVGRSSLAGKDSSGGTSSEGLWNLLDLGRGGKVERAFPSAGARCLLRVQDAATRSGQALTDNQTINKYFLPSVL